MATRIGRRHLALAVGCVGVLAMLGTSLGAAATLPVTSERLTSVAQGGTVPAPSDTTRPQPTSLASQDVAGNSGSPQASDHVTIGWSEPLDRMTICNTPSWTSSSGTWTLGGVVVTITDPGSSLPDVLTASHPGCVGGLHLGSISLGHQNFVSTTRTYAGSTLVLQGGGAEMRLVLGAPDGSPGDHNGNAVMTYTPDAAIADVAGNTVLSTSTVASATARQF